MSFKKGPDQKRIWRLVFPIALLALVIGTTLGGVWHHHANFLADTCPICHLSHQAIEPPLASARVYILVPTGPGPEPQLLASPQVPPHGTFPRAPLPHNSLRRLRAARGTPNPCIALLKKADRPCVYDVCVFQFC